MKAKHFKLLTEFNAVTGTGDVTDDQDTGGRIGTGSNGTCGGSGMDNNRIAENFYFDLEITHVQKPEAIIVQFTPEQMELWKGKAGYDCFDEALENLMNLGRS